MTEIRIVQPEVVFRRSMADDDDVIEAMLVSTMGDEIKQLWDEEGIEGIDGRIRFLMKNRHGTPFEQNYFQFFVKAPIAVFREHHRHRIGWSYNEESGRYKVMKPEFYIPPRRRPLIQTGKPGHYVMSPGSEEQYDQMFSDMRDQFERAYATYENILADDVAKEVARGVLPVYLMTSMFASCNARSMMAFLSLRTDEPTATFPSKPMWEIDELVARIYEEALKSVMPITYKAFCDFGRVAP
jgi:thymidylate synthase, flavin-dependent